MAHPVVMSKSKSGAVLEQDVLKDASTEEIYRELLRRMGEDPNRDGLLRTPERGDIHVEVFIDIDKYWSRSRLRNCLGRGDPAGRGRYYFVAGTNPGHPQYDVNGVRAVPHANGM